MRKLQLSSKPVSSNFRNHEGVGEEKGGIMWAKEIIVGAARLPEYLPLLKGKRVAILTNHTGIINGIHLVDVLLKNEVNIVKIFSPEHGFDGRADDGALINDFIIQTKGIPVASLYRANNELPEIGLENVEIMLYDIQDVGTRFYTYINTMQWFMEASAKNGIPLIILDRPNPNGFYIDGPVLEKRFISEVGVQPVPVVYGMTAGEYANMLIGQHWLRDQSMKLNLTVVKCLNYTHDSFYKLPINPSPNLPNMASVYLYPSLCFFEGTECSVGRGTEFPFQVYGSPLFPKDSYKFTPKSIPGASEPKSEGKLCFGYFITSQPEDAIKIIDRHLQLKWLLKAYHLFPDKNKFFGTYIHQIDFNALAGTDKLQRQIKEGWNETNIRESWAPDLSDFIKIRKRYLLYPDFKYQKCLTHEDLPGLQSEGKRIS